MLLFSFLIGLISSYGMANTQPPLNERVETFEFIGEAGFELLKFSGSPGPVRCSETNREANEYKVLCVLDGRIRSVSAGLVSVMDKSSVMTFDGQAAEFLIRKGYSHQIRSPLIECLENDRSQNRASCTLRVRSAFH